MDEKDLLQKLTNAKMKRLELRTTEQLNRQLHKELTDAEEQLSAAEKDAKNAWNKEEAVARMAKSNDLAFNNTTNYSTYLERKIVAIEDRMQKLSLTKERCNETIRTRALGHLNSIPRVSYLQRQQQLQSALLGKLAAVIERDTHANDATKEETVSNEEARLKIRAEDEMLSGQLVSLRKEIADVACEEEETGELINSCKEAKVEAAELLVKLKTELHALYDSIPDESSFGKCAEDLVAIESEIADLRQQDEGISPVMENLANAIRKLEKSHREEMENICQNSVNDKRALQEELMQIEDESFRAEFELKGILPKKEKYSRLLQQSQAGKSLDQLEEELQACNTELNVQLQQLEQELELEKVALAKEMEECQKDMDVLTAKGASEKENCQVHENSLREEESGLDAEMVEVATELLENEGALAELESKLVNIRNTKENHQQAAAVREREQPPILLQVKEEEDESVVITEIVPTAPGIAPFSPETVRKREDRKKHQHREVVHALRYSDISTDLNDNEEPIRAGRANKTGQTAKRTLKEMSAKEPSPQKIKRREVPMRAAAQAALNKQSLTFREEETVCDQDSLNESPMKEVVQPCVAPPPGFLDDSLYGSDIQNDTMDSLFMERPASNIRCIPEDIFLNTDVTSLENKTSPPGVLSDDDDKECDTSLDQSVWD